ncbi:hypothetical protein [Pseudomonas sp. 31 E 6]|nr:hypothetical protein [Pseudomonas sp. 31 E 6]
MITAAINVLIARPVRSAASLSGAQRLNRAADCVPCRSGGRQRHASATASSPRGMPARNNARQLHRLSSIPPTLGPMAVPTADTVPSKPIARPVRSLVTVSPTMPRAIAIMLAAPSPCRTRAAINAFSDGATAHTPQAKVNNSNPPSSRRRRPRRSPRRPALTMTAVIASR